MILSEIQIDLNKAPVPATAERPGHKYASRRWDGQQWVYDYRDQPARHHGPFVVPDPHEDPSREHSVDLLGSDQVGDSGPEADYHEALTAQMSQPGMHQVSHPTQEGEQMSVEVKASKSGKVKIRATAGDKTKDFASLGSFERWYMGVSNTMVLHDDQGRPWFKLLRNVGLVRSGVLTPSSDPGKQFILRLHELHPDFAEAKGAGQRVEWYKTNQAGGLSHHQKELRNQQMVAAPSEVAQQAPPHPGEPAMEEFAAGGGEPFMGEADNQPTELTSDQEEASATQAGQQPPLEPTVPGTLVDRLESGQLPYRLEAGSGGARRRRRVLDVPVDQKEQMIDEVARQFWGKIVVVATSAVTNNPFFASNPQQWLPRFIGGTSFRMPQPNELDPATGRPMFIGLEPGSMAYRAISDALDNYDPSKGHFASYLAGPGGKLGWNMRRQSAVDQFVNEVKASAPMQMESQEGGTYDRPTDNAGAAAAPVHQDPAAHQNLADVQQSGPEAEEISSTDPWVAQQEQALEQASQVATQISPEVHEQLRMLFNQIRSVPADQRAAYAERFAEGLRNMGLEQFAVDVSKSLEEAALAAILYDQALNKAMDILSKDKNVQPGHTYSHKEGDDDNPRFYFTDQQDNLVQYTNAPEGHADASQYYPGASMHASEPDPAKMSQYFTPDGRKLDRCPPEGCFPEWNQSYNRYDPQNLWVGRWPSAETGDLQYAYIDSDIRAIPKLQTHRMNSLHDDRLPSLRQYIRDLFYSESLKDQLTALALALLDQGCFRAQELAALTPAHIYVEGSMIQLGSRKIFVDPKIQYAFDILKQVKSATEPLFSVPVIGKDGNPDPGLSRRMGSHYWARHLSQQGVSLLSMQTFRATKTFSREVQRLLTVFNASWDQAVNSALLTVALEWGHDLTQEQDAPRITQLILETLIDPVLVELLQTKSQELGLGTGGGGELPPATLLIPAVSMELVDLTSEEKEFSQWLHAQPIHEYAGGQQ